MGVLSRPMIQGLMGMGDDQGKTKRRPVTQADRALGERIKYRREYLGLSQAEVAACMRKHTDRAVGHWESGYARISAIDLMELARVLRCPVGYLTGEEEFSLTDQDREWLGHLGRTLGMLPAGRARDLYKQKLREDVEREAEFLKRLTDSADTNQDWPHLPARG